MLIFHHQLHRHPLHSILSLLMMNYVQILCDKILNSHITQPKNITRIKLAQFWCSYFLLRFSQGLIYSGVLKMSLINFYTRLFDSTPLKYIYPNCVNQHYFNLLYGHKLIRGEEKGVFFCIKIKYQHNINICRKALQHNANTIFSVVSRCDLLQSLFMTFFIISS